jgi:hypothetical protein
MAISREAWEAGKASLQVPVVKYGCHCDLEPGMAPDGCPLSDCDSVDCCIYAQTLRAAGKTASDCEYWKPIQ